MAELAGVELIRAELRASCDIKQSLMADATTVSTIDRAAQRLVRALTGGSKILLAGNGGSAADSQHIAAELMGRFRRERGPLPAIALTTDTSALTAIGNDYGYEFVFERQLRALGRTGDVVVLISTSGKSQNILRAAEAARSLNVGVIGLTGSHSGGLESLCDECIKVPSTDTARIQEAHITIGHIICALVEEATSRQISG